MKLSDNAAMLEINSERSAVHPLLIWDETNLVLIDAGFPGQFALFKQAIEEHGFSLDRLTHILLTHEDLDHIGCLRELVAAAPGVSVFAHEAEAPSICGEAPPNKMMANAAKRELSDEDKLQLEQRIANYKQYTAAVDRLLRDGEVLPICGGIEVIHTPGHTAGHVCYFLQRDRILMTGDTVGISEGALTGPTPMHTADMKQAVESNRKLAEVEATALVAYHGGVFRGDVPTALRNLPQV